LHYRIGPLLACSFRFSSNRFRGMGRPQSTAGKRSLLRANGCYSSRDLSASAEAWARARPSSIAARTSNSMAPRSCSGAARLRKAPSRWMSQSAVATIPIPTAGSPASSLWSVATETPRRDAHDRSDSLRRKRATARSAPSFSMAAEMLGGSRVRARGVFGILIEHNKRTVLVNIYEYSCAFFGSVWDSRF
jgi:hypothetical protein